MQKTNGPLFYLQRLAGPWPDCAPGMSCAKFVPDDEMEAYKRELSTKQVYTKKGAKTWLGTGRPPWAD